MNMDIKQDDQVFSMDRSVETVRFPPILTFSLWEGVAKGHIIFNYIWSLRAKRGNLFKIGNEFNRLPQSLWLLRNDEDAFEFRNQDN